MVPINPNGMEVKKKIKRHFIEKHYLESAVKNEVQSINYFCAYFTKITLKAGVIISWKQRQSWNRVLEIKEITADKCPEIMKKKSQTASR